MSHDNPAEGYLVFPPHPITQGDFKNRLHGPFPIPSAGLSRFSSSEITLLGEIIRLMQSFKRGYLANFKTMIYSVLLLLTYYC